MVIDGRECLYFAGTGYLGIHGRAELLDAAASAMRRYGMGSGTTRAGFGNNPPVLEVERAAAGARLDRSRTRPQLVRAPGSERVG